MMIALIAHSRRFLCATLLVAAMAWPLTTNAQENADVVVPPAEQPASNDSAGQPASNDPGDIIAAYFNHMSDIVTQNMDNPEELLKAFASYIDENEKSMKKASKAFEAKVTSLKSAEAEVYRETVQRKITPSLNKLITLLIDFSKRYPVEAQKLDSLMKVDAKYTYQP